MCEKEDLNIGLVLQYQVAPKGTIDADALVRHARDCGFRGVSIKMAMTHKRMLYKMLVKNMQ